MRSFIIMIILFLSCFGWFFGFKFWNWETRIQIVGSLLFVYGWVMLEIARYLDEVNRNENDR
jgi:hypothetical protein